MSRSVIGTKASLGEVWAATRSRVLRLIALTLLVVLLIAVPILVWAGLVAGAIAIAPAQAWLAAIVGVFGGLATLALVAFLVVKTLFAGPVLVLEGCGIVASLRRAFALTRGTFWRVFGINLLTAVIIGIVTQVISTPASVIAMVAAVDPTGSWFAPAMTVSTALSTIIAGVLTTPFSAAVTALLYIDVRMRTEGLDMELARAAERED